MMPSEKCTKGGAAFDKSRGKPRPKAHAGPLVHRWRSGRVAWRDGRRRATGAAALAQLSPFAVGGAVDKPWVERCSPAATRPADYCAFFVQGLEGYARLAWMRLWISSGALAAGQGARALAAVGGFLYGFTGIALENRRCRDVFHLCTTADLSTAEVDQDVDKLLAHRCRARLAWPVAMRSFFDQAPCGHVFRDFPGFPVGILWICSGWMARPRQWRALAPDRRFAGRCRAGACAQSAGISVWITLGQCGAGPAGRGLRGVGR